MDQDFINAEEPKKVNVNELINKLSTSKEGLSTSEAEKRLQQYGYNEIREEKVPNGDHFRIFLKKGEQDGRTH